jgi:hypothetical protein
MPLKVHHSAAQLRRRRERLTGLHDRLRKQINDADCLLTTLEEYCRENPEDCACVANDPNWREQIVRQRQDLGAMLLAVREKLKE